MTTRATFAWLAAAMLALFASIGVRAEPILPLPHVVGPSKFFTFPGSPGGTWRPDYIPGASSAADLAGKDISAFPEGTEMWLNSPTATRVKFVLRLKACTLGAGAGDGGGEIAVTSGITACWRLAPQSVYDMRWWGAKGGLKTLVEKMVSVSAGSQTITIAGAAFTSDDCLAPTPQGGGHAGCTGTADKLISITRVASTGDGSTANPIVVTGDHALPSFTSTIVGVNANDPTQVKVATAPNYSLTAAQDVAYAYDDTASINRMWAFLATLNGDFTAYTKPWIVGGDDRFGVTAPILLSNSLITSFRWGAATLVPMSQAAFPCSTGVIDSSSGNVTFDVKLALNFLGVHGLVQRVNGSINLGPEFYVTNWDGPCNQVTAIAISAFGQIVRVSDASQVKFGMRSMGNAGIPDRALVHDFTNFDGQAISSIVQTVNGGVTTTTVTLNGSPAQPLHNKQLIQITGASPSDYNKQWYVGMICAVALDANGNCPAKSDGTGINFYTDRFTIAAPAGIGNGSAGNVTNPICPGFKCIVFNRQVTGSVGGPITLYDDGYGVVVTKGAAIHMLPGGFYLQFSNADRLHRAANDNTGGVLDHDGTQSDCIRNFLNGGVATTRFGPDSSGFDFEDCHLFNTRYPTAETDPVAVLIAPGAAATHFNGGDWTGVGQILVDDENNPSLRLSNFKSNGVATSTGTLWQVRTIRTDVTLRLVDILPDETSQSSIGVIGFYGLPGFFLGSTTDLYGTAYGYKCLSVFGAARLPNVYAGLAIAGGTNANGANLDDCPGVTSIFGFNAKGSSLQQASMQAITLPNANVADGGIADPLVNMCNAGDRVVSGATIFLPNNAPQACFSKWFGSGTIKPQSGATLYMNNAAVSSISLLANQTISCDYGAGGASNAANIMCKN